MRKAPFGLWLCRKGRSEPEAIPEYINTVKALCDKRVGKAAVYIRPKVRITLLSAAEIYVTVVFLLLSHTKLYSP